MRWAASALDAQPLGLVLLRRAPAATTEIELPELPAAPPEPTQPAPSQGHDITVELYDQHGDPIPHVAFTLTDPEDVAHELTTDTAGSMYVGGLPAAGTCNLVLSDAQPVQAEEGDWLAFSLAYEDGGPAAGQRYRVEGVGPAVEGTLDDKGSAMLTGVDSGEAKVTFPDLETETDEINAGPAVPTGQTTRLTAAREPLCLELGGFLFDTNKSFLLPGGIEAMQAVREAYELYPKHHVHVIGHTDTTGSRAYNKTLSRERAQAMAAFLRDDYKAWLKWYDHTNEKKRWGQWEDIQMVRALPDAGHLRPTDDSVSWYQRSRGLEVTGEGNDETRERLVKEYMGADNTTLPDSAQLHVEGRGEEEPLVKTGDGVEEAENRRVEVHFCKKQPKPKPKRKKKKAKQPAKPLSALTLRDTEGEDSSTPPRYGSPAVILEVVPSTVTGQNAIDVLLGFEGRPSKDAQWEVEGAEKSGVNTFIVKVPPGDGWNPNAQPTQHVVTATLPGINDLKAAVHAYPNDRIELEFDFDKPAEWQKVIDKINDALDWVGDVKIKKPKGHYKLEAHWKEHTDERAYYWFRVLANIDPLFEFEEGKITVGLGKILKWIRKALKRMGKWGERIGDFLEKLADLGVGVTFSGGAGLDIDMERTSPDVALDAVTNHGKGVVGHPNVGFILEAFGADDPNTKEKDPIIGVEIRASGHFDVEADPFVDDKGVGLALRIRWAGASGSIKGYFLNESETWEDDELFEASKGYIYDDQFYVYEF